MPFTKLSFAKSFEGWIRQTFLLYSTQLPDESINGNKIYKEENTASQLGGYLDYCTYHKGNWASNNYHNV